MDVAALVRPIVEHDGLELVEAVFARDGGRRVLRVTVDREGGVDLDTLSVLSERVSRRLDLEDLGGGRYELEVSSPGIERPLHTLEQYRRFLGSRIKVKTTEPVEDAHVHIGTLLDADDRSIVLDVDGTRRTLALPAVTLARTIADWDAELKRSNA